jgi:choline dehydrogenase
MPAVEPPDGRSWTHIVIGAGAAGCAVAARLSEDLSNRVLLIEAGGRGRDPMIRVPMATGLLLRGNRHTWQFQTEAVPGLDGRTILLPRGRVLGGSTAINGMVYVRGLATDYDQWAQSGLQDWSYERVRPWFVKSENFLGPGGDRDHHGADGPLAVSRRERPVSILADCFVEAGQAAGYPVCADFNAPGPEGFGHYHFTNRNGRRVSAADAFLSNAGGNLRILTDCLINRLIVENRRVRGVEIHGGSGAQTLMCDGEIILSAGVIGSPSILLRSGIGPANDLHALGIPLIVDLPDVGRNFHDHVLVRVKHRATKDATLFPLTRIDRAAFAFMQALLFGSGPMSVFPLEAGAYVRSPGADMPDIQSHFLPALSSATLRLNPLARSDTDNIPGFMANASVMRPQSRGALRLRSANPDDPPVIQPNYLAERYDVERLIDGVEILREVFAQQPFDAYRGAEIEPGPDVRSRAQIEAFVRQTADTVHHAVGTCRMGADDASVVDSKLRVRGVQGLRVADASVFPAIPSANTAAASIMVGERAAGFIRSE